jgi:hypothetical protein
VSDIATRGHLILNGTSRKRETHGGFRIRIFFLLMRGAART